MEQVDQELEPVGLELVEQQQVAQELVEQVVGKKELEQDGLELEQVGLEAVEYVGRQSNNQTVSLKNNEQERRHALNFEFDNK